MEDGKNVDMDQNGEKFRKVKKEKKIGPTPPVNTQSFFIFFFFAMTGERDAKPGASTVRKTSRKGERQEIKLQMANQMEEKHRSCLTGGLNRSR